MPPERGAKAKSHQRESLDMTHTTGIATLDAEADFRRARRSHTAARLGRVLTRGERHSHPRALPERTAMRGGPARLQVVPLSSIVGTVEPTAHFDARFRPASEVVRHRWERIALARRRGVALPPIRLRKQSDGYYVLDGRHRVSVARAFGQPDIDAWVTGTQLAEIAPMTESVERPAPARRHAQSR